ncbi:MAG: 50S ribosomal protein L14 [Candidatus Chisholmbacteria bacterium RIFCSPHIGHO2_01_FULL_49_18]|jgi:large subunit ribosomal protein L14|uniref:Large ribosomal subunit protein uL14 n=2 Tax=Candidatus Chisholmiibacteriota TaxID=1817900 RepID=A0A1G1VLT1_9BACT|nr:MAG: 50S ribosomal protein L14 [Candidatus Chisholmbacteria bacterium RIFCSPHIGHO2_01_FULL_49_18]OGY19381.1 MAG: 50S ribosomal protein L14 [Candidatus Chisholmbacteria bacterium RIFCSPLOWO2_01_FULL_49_14]
MIQTRSVLKPADNTGAKLLRVLLVHGGSKRKYGYVSDIVSASVIDADPQGQVRKGEKVKAVIVRTKKEFHRKDGSYIRFDENAAVIIDAIATKNPRGTRIFGPIAREVKEAGFAKIASLAEEVL